MFGDDNRPRASDRESILNPNIQALFRIELFGYKGSRRRISTSEDGAFTGNTNNNKCLRYES